MVNSIRSSEGRDGGSGGAATSTAEQGATRQRVTRRSVASLAAVFGGSASGGTAAPRKPPTASHAIGGCISRSHPTVKEIPMLRRPNTRTKTDVTKVKEPSQAAGEVPRAAKSIVAQAWKNSAPPIAVPKVAASSRSSGGSRTSAQQTATKTLPVSPLVDTTTTEAAAVHGASQAESKEGVSAEPAAADAVPVLAATALTATKATPVEADEQETEAPRTSMHSLRPRITCGAAASSATPTRRTVSSASMSPAKTSVVTRAAALQTRIIPSAAPASTPTAVAPASPVSEATAPKPATPLATRGCGSQSVHAMRAAAASVSSESDGGWSDSETEEDGEGDNVVSRLAASIREALCARARIQAGPAGVEAPDSPCRQLNGTATGTKTAARQDSDGTEAAQTRGSGGDERAEQAASGVSRSGSDDDGDLARSVQWRPQLQLPSQRFYRRVQQIEEELPAKECGLAKQLLVPRRDAKHLLEAARKAKPDTAGASWYNLPATQVTEETKLELRLLRLRGALDPKRFYKSADRGRFPRYFSVGTVLDNAADFYSTRLAKRERKESLAKELMADAGLTALRRKRYQKLQDESKKYSKVKKRKTDMPRNARRPKKPKH